MRLTLRVVVVLLAALALVGCGGTTTKTVTKTVPATTAPPSCTNGTMGCAVPPAKLGAAPPITSHVTLIPDVSEFQPCALHSEAIYRVYEAGTNREDTTARCHAAEIHRLHVWSGTYAFLRPGSCTGEATRTVEIVRSLGGSNVVVADAEVPLPRGFVRCFLATVRAHGDNAAEYTCPGCGDEQVGPVWIAAYPFRPVGKWIAHQFADNFNCRGVQGDCSVDEGILSIGKAKPKPKPKPKPISKAAQRRHLIARRQALRVFLAHDGCRRRRARHEHLGPKCKAAFAAGDRVNRELADASTGAEREGLPWQPRLIKSA